jgi:hypothetical protein
MVPEGHPFAAQTIKVRGTQEFCTKVRDKIRAPLINDNQ